MKIFFSILFFLIPVFTIAQFSDNFSDGDFTGNPAWTGDNAKWIVNSGQLQSNSGTASDIFHLSTASTLATDAQWELTVRLDFSTSSNNYVDIYVTSDSSNVTGTAHGYFVRIGNTADEISLYRKDGASSTKIIDGADGRSQPASSNNIFHLLVKRSAANDWMLQDDNTGGNNLYTEGLVNDATYLTSSYFGIAVTQSTASFFNKHFFDDISAGAIPIDSTPPVVVSAQVIDSVRVDVRFSEAVEMASSSTEANYLVDQGIGNAATAARDAVDLALVHLVFAIPFTSGTTYQLLVSNVNDLSGNVITTGNAATFSYFVPSPVLPLDLVFNEILFNARTGGVEFVEIYNRSMKVIDLKNMKFTREDLTTHVLDPAVTITSSTRLLLPGEYVVLSDDSTKVISQYISYPGTFINMNLPDLLTEEDILVLEDPLSATIDQLHYYSSWHFPLLNDVDGVSLERLNPDRPTQDVTNWHSAAETVGFATPGYRNSEYSASGTTADELTVDPEIFSPDEDGHNDVVNLKYHFDMPGFVATVNIYDSKGRLIRNLVNNELLGNDGSFTWDGVTNSKDKARIGIYIFYVEVYNLDGETKQFKKSCVLASKM